MIKLIHIVLLLFTANFCVGQSSFDLGNKAYIDANYTNAIAHFEKAIEEDPGNISAYYNLGMTHQQNRSFGKAIWAYEKVLKLDPSDEQAEEQIMHCFLELKGSDFEWTSSVGPLEKVIFGFSSFSWSIIAIVLSILFATTIIYRILKPALSKSYFYLVSIGSGVLLIVVIMVAKKTFDFEYNQTFGIVTKHSVTTKLESAKDAQGPTLSEGSRLKIIGISKSGFYEVEDENKNIYLIEQEDIDLI